MEVYIDVSFAVDEENKSFWESVFDALQEGKVATIFHKNLSGFGEVVEGELDAMLDKWPMEYFIPEGWSCEQGRISASFLTASDGAEFAKELVYLFGLCPVKELEISVYEDDE